MPEQRDLFLERSNAGVAVHAINGFGQRSLDVAALLPVDVVPLDDVFFQRRLVLWMQQPLDRFLIAPGAIGIEFRRGSRRIRPDAVDEPSGRVGSPLAYFHREGPTPNARLQPIRRRSEERPLSRDLEDRRPSYHSGRSQLVIDSFGVQRRLFRPAPVVLTTVQSERTMFPLAPCHGVCHLPSRSRHIYP